MDKLTLYYRTYLDYVKLSNAIGNRLNRFPEEIRKQIEENSTFKEFLGSVKKSRESITKLMKQELENDEIYQKFLSRIKGVKVLMAGGLIALLCRERDFTLPKTHPHLEKIKQKPYAKIEEVKENPNVYRVILPPVLDVAKHVSDVYKYCGVIPGTKKKRGEALSSNLVLKSLLLYKIPRQILMAGKSYYVELYRTWKAIYIDKYTKKGEAHPKAIAEWTARRKLARHLLTSLYLLYKFLHKQPAYLPYPVEKLGHEIEYPFVDGPDGPERLEFLVDYAKNFKKEGGANG
jgi:hypothetical protein